MISISHAIASVPRTAVLV